MAPQRTPIRPRPGLTFLAGVVLLLGLAMPLPGGAESPTGTTVYVVPVSATVDPGMTAFIKRALSVDTVDPSPYFVIELDTFGGRVDSALEIVEALLEIPRDRSIAFVKTNAISAGALIALACGRIAMKPNTSIGDCAPIAYSNEGPQMLGEKFQSPLRAKFRTLARRNGYPETLAESMVTAEMTVFSVELDGKTQYMDAESFDDLTPEQKQRVASKKTIVAAGELLTMDDTEAAELGFSSMSVDSIDDMLKRMNIPHAELIPVEETWSEGFVRMIGAISPYLLIIGLAALYMEIKAPGFGLLGIIGIASLALVFLNQYLVGLADYTEILIILLGVVALGFEVFVIPGFGIAGITGLLLIAVGTVLAFQDFVIPDPSLPWQADLLLDNVLRVIAALCTAVITTLVIFRYVLPRLSAVVKGPYLDATLRNSHADSSETRAIGVGDHGIAMTFLRPSGKVKIRNEIYDVITDGEFMEKGTPVTVSAIKGNRIIVSKGSEDA